jgi:glucosamine--fructose-6-phosphate aminotransferase (isomerizing)
MCGIVGYLGMDSDAVSAVLSGLDLLQNRGYDSCGMSIIEAGEIRTHKFASTNTNNALSLLHASVETHSEATVAIGHTRWATHGSKTDINAHPHHDSNDRITLVHNGIIENFFELKTQLISLGHTFKSATDTEIIAVLIGSFLDKGLEVTEAINEAVACLKGTWALVILHRDYPRRMWAVRNGSPLLLGTNTHCIMLASEAIAFNRYANQYIVLKDHIVLEIKRNGMKFEFNKNLQKYESKIHLCDKVETSPAPWPHWMLKEIMEQPESIVRAINNGGRIASETTVKLGGLDAFRTELSTIDHLILLGCGTSYHAGLWALDVFKGLHCFDTVALYDGADFGMKDVPNKGKTAAVLLSQSGETKDLQRCIQVIREGGLFSIGVVNVIDSFIARETTCGVYLNAGREVAVASTKSFTNQCVVLALIAVWFSQEKGTCEEKRRKIIADLHQLPLQMAYSISPEVRTLCKNHSAVLCQSTSSFLLGKGKEEAIAKEGALKIKEISRIHAEGYSTSALKHGPFGLLEPALPVIILDIGEDFREKTTNAIQEVDAREAHIIILSDNIKDPPVCGVMIEYNETFGGILANACLQLVAYFCACHKEISPDYPRNLAKVVTVE